MCSECIWIRSRAGRGWDRSEHCIWGQDGISPRVRLVQTGRGLHLGPLGVYEQPLVEAGRWRPWPCSACGRLQGWCWSCKEFR